jgi:hypothetical protein
MSIVFVMVVVLPIYLIYYFGEVNKHSEYGILQDSLPYVNSCLHQQLSIKDCVRVVATCMEFNALKVNKMQTIKLDLIIKQFSEEENVKNLIRKNYYQYIKTAIVLINARISETVMP